MALLLPYLDFWGSPCPRNYHCHIFIVNLIVRIIVDIQYLCFELQHYLHHVLMVSLCFPVTVGYAVMPFLSCLLGKFLHMTHYLLPRSFLLQIPIFRVKSSCFARIVQARVFGPRIFGVADDTFKNRPVTKDIFEPTSYQTIWGIHY